MLPSESSVLVKAKKEPSHYFYLPTNTGVFAGTAENTNFNQESPF